MSDSEFIVRPDAVFERTVRSRHRSAILVFFLSIGMVFGILAWTFGLIKGPNQAGRFEVCFRDSCLTFVSKTDITPRPECEVRGQQCNEELKTAQSVLENRSRDLTEMREKLSRAETAMIDESSARRASEQRAANAESQLVAMKNDVARTNQRLQEEQVRGQALRSENDELLRSSALLRQEYATANKELFTLREEIHAGRTELAHAMARITAAEEARHRAENQAAERFAECQSLRSEKLDFADQLSVCRREAQAHKTLALSLQETLRKFGPMPRAPGSIYGRFAEQVPQQRAGGYRTMSSSRTELVIEEDVRDRVRAEP